MLVYAYVHIYSVQCCDGNSFLVILSKGGWGGGGGRSHNDIYLM